MERNDAYPQPGTDPRWDDPAMREVYAEGMEWACGQLGHQTRLGEDACICGKLTSTEHITYKKALDRYHALAADAYCLEHEHSDKHGRTGYSWRDGTCCCDYDVEAVLKAIGEVAAHVSCREEIVRSQRLRDEGWAEVDRIRAEVKELRHAANSLLLNPDDLDIQETTWALVLRDDPEFETPPNEPSEPFAVTHGDLPADVAQAIAEAAVRHVDQRCGDRKYEERHDPNRPPDPPSPVCHLDAGHDGRHQGRTMHGTVTWPAVTEPLVIGGTDG